MLFLCFLALEVQLQQTCVHRKHQSIAPKVLAIYYVDLQYQFLFASSINKCSLFPLLSGSPLAGKMHSSASKGSELTSPTAGAIRSVVFRLCRMKSQIKLSTGSLSWAWRSVGAGAWEGDKVSAGGPGRASAALLSCCPHPCQPAAMGMGYFK